MLLIYVILFYKISFVQYEIFQITKFHLSTYISNVLKTNMRHPKLMVEPCVIIALPSHPSSGCSLILISRFILHLHKILSSVCAYSSKQSTSSLHRIVFIISEVSSSLVTYIILSVFSSFICSSKTRVQSQEYST